MKAQKRLNRESRECDGAEYFSGGLGSFLHVILVKNRPKCCKSRDNPGAGPEALAWCAYRVNPALNMTLTHGNIPAEPVSVNKCLVKT